MVSRMCPLPFEMSSWRMSLAYRSASLASVGLGWNDLAMSRSSTMRPPPFGMPLYASGYRSLGLKMLRMV